nr:hypothetical protein [Tanacetum cinerariifolium]
MSADELEKETGSSDGLRPKQSDLSCAHALNELHLHEIHVVLSMHEANQYVNHINFFDVEYPEMLNDDERVANDLNKGKSDSSSSSVSGSNLNTADFPIDSGNDVDSSDGLVATQNEEVATLEKKFLRIDRYKARLVAHDFGQKKGIDYEETFSPVVKKVTVRCMLNIDVCLVRESLIILYTKSAKGVFLALLVYVDDTIITGIYLNQRKYVLDLLSEYGMLACKPAKTSLMSKLVIFNEASENDPLLENVADYKILMGKLIYLTNNTPDISYVVHCLITAGYCVFLNNSVVSWKSKKQNTLSKSLTDAEYRALASVTSEVIWILNFLKDLQIEIFLPVSLHCDSNSTIKIAANLVFYERTKHLEIDLHFVRENILNGVVKTVKVDSEHQIADILTKGLDTIQHCELAKKLGMYDVYQHLGYLRWPPRKTLGRLLPHAGGLGFDPLREGFPSGAKKEGSLSPKTKVRVLHTGKIECHCELESLIATFRTLLSCNKWSYIPHDVVNLYRTCISLFYN